MPNQHHPPESGTRPKTRITAVRPDCPDQRRECSWVLRPRFGDFELKYIHGGCLAHKPSPEDTTPPPEPLAVWLGAA